MSSSSIDCQNPPTPANHEPTKPQLKSTLTRTDRERKIERESHRNRGSRMSKFRDPAIKLFGKTIPLPTKEQFVSVLDVSATIQYTSTSASASALLHKPNGDDKNPSEGNLTKSHQPSNQVSEDLKDSKTPSSIDKETTTSSSPNEEQNDTSESQEKTLKKPDKIIPCPRCNSMDTKFCYYNNYNVNQPRHFCKNCQRYWTAGGTMRNVPIGAGRRKNKHSSAASLHYRHIFVPDSLQSAQSNILNFGNSGNHPPPPPPPLCESMASVLNLAATEKTPQNGFNNRQEMVKGEDHSSSIEKGCSYVGSIQEQQMMMMMMMMNFQGFPGPPWPFHWPNSSQWNNHNTAMPLPSFCPPPGFPLSFLPPPNTPTFWGCSLPAAAATWNMPWLPQPQPPTTSPNCPILGKHSREGNMIQEENKVPERSSEVWIPKTLRIDDPSEAAKSSIWETLGIKNDKTSSINEGGLFKSFQSKGEEKKNAHITDTYSMLQANPAALSRSQNFHENS